MKLLFKKIFILIIFILYSIVPAKSDSKIYYIDLDFILQNTDLGKNIILELDTIKKKNDKKYQIIENELKQKEISLINSKNVISEKEFNTKITELQNQIENFLNENNKINNNFQNLKKEKFNLFFQKISPIIQDYMGKNSIDILFEKKNIFISKSEYDISNEIIKILNN